MLETDDGISHCMKPKPLIQPLSASFSEARLLTEPRATDLAHLPCQLIQGSHLPSKITDTLLTAQLFI